MCTDVVNISESNGHTLNGNTENGVTTANNGPITLAKTDQDIVRLIGQYLKIVGLGWVDYFFLIIFFFVFVCMLTVYLVQCIVCKCICARACELN